MKPTWRWFGPDDNISLGDIAQAGAAGIVTALHDVPNGAVWSAQAIEKRKAVIGEWGGGALRWEVVESLPVSEDIKLQSGQWRAHIENYKASLRNLARGGLSIVCYNFMPVLDWTRTDIAHRLPHGGHCMRFDAVDFALFDMFILARKDARRDYSKTTAEAAQSRFALMDAAQKKHLTDTILLGLPGAEIGYDLPSFKAQLARYDGICADTLRRHQIDFLGEVIPVAEDCGIKLCCHPDDPPFALLGLPRIMSTHDDYKNLFSAVGSEANGITFCAGSLGADAKNDLPKMLSDLAPRVHFVHLRNIVRETNTAPATFYESSHLDGAVDMVEVIKILLIEEKRRKAEGRQSDNIPYRPDHGQAILTDLSRSSAPGYPAIGRLKGLAELRGIIAALNHKSHHKSCHGDG